MLLDEVERRPCQRFHQPIADAVSYLRQVAEQALDLAHFGGRLRAKLGSARGDSLRVGELLERGLEGEVQTLEPLSIFRHARSYSTRSTAVVAPRAVTARPPSRFPRAHARSTCSRVSAETERAPSTSGPTSASTP